MKVLLFLLRWFHIFAGIVWIGYLYFFNLANAKFKNVQYSNFMGSLDAPTKLKVYPLLMPKTLWWFRWGAFWTVLFGLILYILGFTQKLYAMDQGTHKALMITVLWLLVIYIINFLALKLTADDKNQPLHQLMFLLVVGLWAFALWVPTGMRAGSGAVGITVGGGLGILMLLNVWGIIWRNQKVIIQAHVDQAAGKEAPPNLAKLTKVAGVASRTNFWLSIPMLFFMASASHLPLP